MANTTTAPVKINNKLKTPTDDKIFYAIVYVIMAIFVLVCALPLLNIVANSLSSGKEVSAGRVTFWPRDFSIESYVYVFQYRNVVQSFINSIVITVLGTLIKSATCMMMAYPMARADKMPGFKWIMIFILIPNYIGGGTIPTYMNISRLGLMDTIWCLVLPTAVPIGSAITARVFLTNGINGELQDAADIDGCSDTQFFFRMVLPLSKVIIATNAMMFVSGYWNSYFGAMIYIRTEEKYPLQLVLRNLLSAASNINMSDYENPELLAGKLGMTELIKYAFCVIATLPMVVIYPFVQKYLVQGTMLGSVKG